MASRRLCYSNRNICGKRHRYGTSHSFLSLQLSCASRSHWSEIQLSLGGLSASRLNLSQIYKYAIPLLLFLLFHILKPISTFLSDIKRLFLRRMPPPKRTVLITGCSDGGLGAALAITFHEAGLHVYATSRDPSKMNDLQARGIEILTLDVLSDSSIAACVSKVSSLDILVNNAGGGGSTMVSVDKLVKI